MARYVSIVAGAYDTASNWGQVTNTPTRHATTNLTLTSGTYYTATFTASGLTDQALGVAIAVANYTDSGGNTVTCTLQEYNGATWSDVGSATRNKADLSINGLNLFEITPYTFTTVTAGYYRWKITQTGINTIVVADSGGTLTAFMSVDNRTGIPTTSDAVFLLAGSTTPRTMTITGTEQCGNTTGATSLLTYRDFTLTGMYQSDYGKLTFSKAGTDKLEIKGNWWCGTNGVIDADFSATSNTLNIEWDYSTADGDFGFYQGYNSQIIMKGKPKSSTTLWETHFVSGTGVTGDELVTADDVDWDVNDRIVFTATDAYNHVETRYIKTKVDAHTYTISSTVGGAESALSYTHTTDAWIVNEERNIKWTSKDPTKGYYFTNLQTDSTSDKTFEWIQFLNPCGGAATVGRRGIQYLYQAGTYIDFNYNVCIDPTLLVYRFGFNTASDKGTDEYTGLIQDGGDWFYCASPNKVYNDCFAIRTVKIGLEPINTGNITFNDCVANGCNTSGASYWGGVLVNSATVITFNNCDFQCNRNASVSLNTCSATRFVNCNLGNLAPGTVTVYGAFDVSNEATFINCKCDTGITLYSNYLDLNYGSKVRFHKINQVDNVHRVYESGGYFEPTGAGLTDTTTLYAGSLCMGMNVEDDVDGCIWEFQIPARSGDTIFANGLTQKNAQMAASDAFVELYLPGSVTADDTYYLPYDSAINHFAVDALYTGATNDMATVRVIAKSVAAGARFYVDQIYNGSDIMNSLDTWNEAEPAKVMVLQAGDPLSIWQVVTSAFIIPGTIGYWLYKKIKMIFNLIA